MKEHCGIVLCNWRPLVEETKQNPLTGEGRLHTLRKTAWCNSKAFFYYMGLYLYVECSSHLSDQGCQSLKLVPLLR